MRYSLLRGRIRAYFHTQEDFALALGRSPSTISKRLCGASEWPAKDIRKACDLLHIAPQDIPAYFFCTDC